MTRIETAGIADIPAAIGGLGTSFRDCSPAGLPRFVQCGAMMLIRRFGGVPNLNMRFHEQPWPGGVQTEPTRVRGASRTCMASVRPPSRSCPGWPAPSRIASGRAWRAITGLEAKTNPCSTSTVRVATSVRKRCGPDGSPGETQTKSAPVAGRSACKEAPEARVRRDVATAGPADSPCSWPSPQHIARDRGSSTRDRVRPDPCSGTRR